MWCHLTLSLVGSDKQEMQIIICFGKLCHLDLIQKILKGDGVFEKKTEGDRNKFYHFNVLIAV